MHAVSTTMCTVTISSVCAWSSAGISSALTSDRKQSTSRTPLKLDLDFRDFRMCYVYYVYYVYYVCKIVSYAHLESHHGHLAVSCV
jgi:hypothetical protein